jgi:hypothetical protein
MSRTFKKITARASQALALSGILALLAAGCSKEKSVNAAAADLEKAFQTKAPEPAETPVQAPSVTSEPAPAPQPPPRDQAKKLVQQAVSALQSNGYAVAFATLRAAQTAPNITVDQYDAIEKARLAVEREMAAKAVSGDANAQQSLQAIQALGH